MGKMLMLLEDKNKKNVFFLTRNVFALNIIKLE